MLFHDPWLAVVDTRPAKFKENSARLEANFELIINPHWGYFCTLTFWVTKQSSLRINKHFFSFFFFFFFFQINNSQATLLRDNHEPEVSP